MDDTEQTPPEEQTEPVEAPAESSGDDGIPEDDSNDSFLPMGTLDNPVTAQEMDSLFVLPLAILPFKTPALRTARLIKNHRLESIVEMFSGPQTGSGQVEISELPNMFNWPKKTPHPDYLLMKNLADLPSFDVYSLRVLLRETGVKVNNVEALKLSKEKQQELSVYMKNFTRPLIMQIYGGEVGNIDDFNDVVKLFRDPDIKKAKQRLQKMARKLGIGIEEVPKFLEDYGDIFLSLSYYRQCLDQIFPMLEEFIVAMEELRENWQMRQDMNLMRTCDNVETTLNALSAEITSRFESFDRNTKAMWSDITAERFEMVRQMIEGYHTTIGGILCTLTVKMNAWNEKFPKKDAGGPVKRSEFLMAEMKPGIDDMKKLEEAFPLISSVD